VIFHYTIIYFILCSLLFVPGGQVYAQQKLSAVTTLLSKEIWFDKQVGFENSGIVNGPEYLIPMQGSTTHPFYGSRDLSLESVVFNGQRYGNVALMYDIYSDVLILRHRDKNGIFVLIKMDKEYVDSFTLYGHQFKKISIADSNKRKLTSQFFDVSFDGETIDLIAKRKKTTHVVGSRPEFVYDEKFYIHYNNELTPVNSKKSIYQLVYGGEKIIQEYINKNKFNFRVEKDLVQIAAFCDSLSYALNK